MKVLVTGAGGQVGSELVRLDAPGFSVSGLKRDELDIAEYAQIERQLDVLAPDIVVNCAAYTAVDRAEDEPRLAYAANADAVGALGEACTARGIGIIHLSTDYVFDGTKDASYREDDAPNPLGVYGASKLAGEQALRTTTERCVILRVSWVFGRLGRGFVDTMLALARERREIAVVDDQIGAPSPATAIAETVRDIAKTVLRRNDRWGTYHYSTTPALSWCSFAREIVRLGADTGVLNAVPSIRAISTAEWSAKAARPLNSRLDDAKLRRAFGLGTHSWRPSLQEYVLSLREPTDELGSGATSP